MAKKEELAKREAHQDPEKLEGQRIAWPTATGARIVQLIGFHGGMVGLLEDGTISRVESVQIETHDADGTPGYKEGIRLTPIEYVRA